MSLFFVYMLLFLNLSMVLTLKVNAQAVIEDNDETDTEISEETDYVVTRLSTGLIRGRVSYEAGPHRPAHIFQGVPISEPPVGKLRWKRLKPRRPWKGVFDATRYGPACLSNTTETRSPQKNISEDCIYTNIFADPACKLQKNPCPILYYIHGGGFRYDSATMFNETQIVQKYASDGVIFVISAYRMAAFGFLDLQNESVVKKNLGIYDILYGLRWTKREVPAAFGGDPNRITIMGNSAGATVSLVFLTSPLVKKGTFHQAFISSGDIELMDSPNRRPSNAIASRFNCTSKNESAQETLNCLREIPALEILREQQHLETIKSDDGHSLKFQGISADGALIPGPNSIAQMRFWKKDIRVVLTTTLWEMDSAVAPTKTRSVDNFKKEKRELATMSLAQKATKETDKCHEAMSVFNMRSEHVLQSCIDRYQKDPMGANYEMYHSSAVMMAAINRLRGSVSYVGSFELKGYTGHADDMVFFFGLHYTPPKTHAEEMMNRYYPVMMKRFLKIGVPDAAWKTVDRYGRGYFVLDFVVNDNGTLSSWPHFVPGNYSDPEAVNFWLRQMPVLERSSTKSFRKQLKKSNNDKRKGRETKVRRRMTMEYFWNHNRNMEEFYPFSMFFTNNSLNEEKIGENITNGASSTADNLGDRCSLEFAHEEMVNEEDEEEEYEDENDKDSSLSLPFKTLTDIGIGELIMEKELSRVWIALWFSWAILIICAMAMFIRYGCRTIYLCKLYKGGYEKVLGT